MGKIKDRACEFEDSVCVYLRKPDTVHFLGNLNANMNIVAYGSMLTPTMIKMLTGSDEYIFWELQMAVTKTYL